MYGPGPLYQPEISPPTQDKSWLYYHTGEGEVRSLPGGEDNSDLARLFVLFMFHVFRFMARKSDMKMSFVKTKQLKCTIVLFCPNS